MSKICVKLDLLDKCVKLFGLREDTDEIRDLFEVTQTLNNINNSYFDYIQNLISRMEQKYAKEIDILESMASIFSSNNVNSSHGDANHTKDDPIYNALLRIQFAICLKICLKKSFINCVEEFMDISQYK